MSSTSLYQDVLRARLADAEFFYKNDCASPLDSFVPKLASMTFQKDLGSVADHVDRVTSLTPHVATQLGASEAQATHAVRTAQLYKADLGTSTVSEMTGLAGIMG